MIEFSVQKAGRTKRFVVQKLLLPHFCVAIYPTLSYCRYYDNPPITFCVFDSVE